MSTTVLVVTAEEVPGSDTPKYLFLGQRGGIQGLRPWCDTLEDERVEWFGNRAKAGEAAATYGGVLVDADRIEHFQLEEGWKTLEPATIGRGDIGL